MAGDHSLLVVADAGMLSGTSLQSLDAAGYGFTFVARQTKTPLDLEDQFWWHGYYLIHGQVIDTITPRHGTRKERDTRTKAEPAWDPALHLGSWRAMWACSTKRACRDNKTLTAQNNRTRAIIAGEKTMLSARFVTTTGARILDEQAPARARRLAGLKNIPATP